MSRGRRRSAVVALVVSVAILVTGTAVAPTPRTTKAEVKIRSDMWTRLNDERSARHLPPLVWSGRLSERSAAWSKTMSESGFRHSDIGALLGPNDYVGENIGHGGRTTTSGQISVAFMKSQYHRDDNLSPGFTQAGIGVFCAKDHDLWVTVEFVRKTSQGLPPPYDGGTPQNPIARPDGGGSHC